MRRFLVGSWCLVCAVCRRVGVAEVMLTGDGEDMVRYEVLAGVVGAHDSPDEVLRNVLEVGQQLFGVFGQAVSAVAKRGIVVVITDARVEADACNDLGSVESLDFGVGVELVEVADAQRQVGVGEELGGLRFGEAHEDGGNVLLDRALLQERGEDLGFFQSLFVFLVISDDDAARIKVVVEGFGFAQEFGAEEDVVSPELLADLPGVAHRDCGFDDNSGLFGIVCCYLQNQFDDGLYSRAVKIVFLLIIVGRHGDNDEVGIFVCGRSVCGGGQVELTLAFFGLAEVFLNIFVFDRGFEVVDLFNSFGKDVDGGNIIVLGEQSGQGETDVASSRHCDLV